MWLFLWVIFVLCAAGFFLWSYHSTFEQKKGWKAYAQKMGLTYSGGALLDSPEMTGEIKKHRVNFYPDFVENAQGQRSTQNVIEVFLNIKPDLACVVASPGFSDFLIEIDLPESFTVEDNNWPKSALSRCPTGQLCSEWFTGQRSRIDAIQQLLKLPFNSAFVSDQNNAFVVIRTANPISDPRRLNQVVNKLIVIAEMLQTNADQPTMAKPKDDKETVEPETSAPKE